MRFSLVLTSVLPFLNPTLALAASSSLSALRVNDVLARSATAYAQQQHHKRDDVSDILTDIEDLAECSACQALLVVLQALAHVGNDAFSDTIIAVCEALQIEDDDVCAGAIGLEGPILAHDLRQMSIPSKTSELFCLTVFGLCQWPAVDTSFDLGLSAKPANATRPEPSGQTPLQIVHISDIHIDLNYTAGASYNCTKNVCCRPYDADDTVGVTEFPAGPYGNPACDSPVTLEESLYDAIVSLVPNRAFTIFTGDTVVGDVWLTTDAEVTGTMDDSYARMTSIGQTYAVMGNHDSSPVNSFPPAAVDTTYADETQLFYDELAGDITAWVGDAAAAEVSGNFGSYSTLDATTGARIISVNTNFWYKSNYWLYEATMESDPSGMLSWLAAQLEAAETAGERVWLMGHMPLGSADAFHDQSYYFDKLIQRFAGTIAAVFYGHTHKDEFQIAYANYSRPTADTATMMSYIAPALTPTSGNPTFRVYDVDPVTMGILDVTVYYANISSSTYQTDGPTWEKLYSVKETYGAALGYTDASAELTPAFWHNVTTLFESDDAIFQQYYARKTRDFSTATCDADCKAAEICQLRAAQSQFNCVVVSPGINLRKRQEDEESTVQLHEEHACENSVVAPVMGAIYSTEGVDALRSALVGVVGEAFLNTTVEGNFTVAE